MKACASLLVALVVVAGAQAQEEPRQTVLRSLALNGISLQGRPWDSLVIAPEDTLSLAYACRCPPSPTPLLFRITLRRYDDNREQVRSLGVDSVLYTQLPEGSYSFTVQAFAPAEGWYAAPVTLHFRVSAAEAPLWKQRFLRNVQETQDSTSAPDSTAAASGTHAGDGWLWWVLALGLGSATAILGVFILWYRSMKRRRLPQKHSSPAPAAESVPLSAYETLLAENSRLKAELSNLRGQISALEARSRHLQQENKALREQVERLSEKQRELEELQEQKDALFATLVHDIKNPALVIRSLVELLRSYDFSAQEQQEIINDIVETTTRIVELSQEISRILALEAKVLQLNIQPVDVAEVIRAICHQNKPTAEQKSIALLQEVEPGLPLLSADPQRLEEILDNLVSNAIKYSPPGSAVIVRAYLRDGRMHLEVEDNGLGMSEEDVRNAFQRGMRLSAKPTGGEPSSGLGLWIVKRLVEAHHGTVRIRSALGKGTTVHVELPLEQPEHPAAEAPAL